MGNVPTLQAVCVSRRAWAQTLEGGLGANEMATVSRRGLALALAAAAFGAVGLAAACGAGPAAVQARVYAPSEIEVRRNLHEWSDVGREVEKKKQKKAKKKRERAPRAGGSSRGSGRSRSAPSSSGSTSKKKNKKKSTRRSMGTSYSSPVALTPSPSLSSITGFMNDFSGAFRRETEPVEEEPYESYEVPEETAVVREDGGVCGAGCDSCVAVEGAEECCNVKDSDCQRCADGETDEWPCTSDNIFRCRCEMKAEDNPYACTSKCDTCTAHPDATANFGITDDDCARCADGVGDGEEPLAWPCGPDEWMVEQNNCLCQMKASDNPYACTSECDTCTAHPDGKTHFDITDDDCAPCADGVGEGDEPLAWPCGSDQCFCVMIPSPEEVEELQDSIAVLRGLSASP